MVSPKLITNFNKIFWYKLYVILKFFLKLSIFFDQRISSKFTYCFFKIFLNFPRNIFEIILNFPGHFTNFLVHKVSSHFFMIFQIQPIFFRNYPEISSTFTWNFLKVLLS